MAVGNLNLFFRPWLPMRNIMRAAFQTAKGHSLPAVDATAAARGMPLPLPLSLFLRSCQKLSWTPGVMITTLVQLSRCPAAAAAAAAAAAVGAAQPLFAPLPQAGSCSRYTNELKMRLTAACCHCCSSSSHALACSCTVHDEVGHNLAHQVGRQSKVDATATTLQQQKASGKVSAAWRC
jgi:hypothetical protein